MNTAQRLQQLRKEKGMSQEELAARYERRHGHDRSSIRFEN